MVKFWVLLSRMKQGRWALYWDLFIGLKEFLLYSYEFQSALSPDTTVLHPALTYQNGFLSLLLSRGLGIDSFFSTIMSRELLQQPSIFWWTEVVFIVVQVKKRDKETRKDTHFRNEEDSAPLPHPVPECFYNETKNM